MIIGLAAIILFSQVIVGIDTKSKFVDQALIVTTSGLKEGGEYDPKLIAAAIHKLYNIGLFKQVSIDTNVVGDGVYITIAVVENPQLKGEPVFEGNKKIKAKTLREKTNLKTGESLSDKKIFDAKRAVIDYYQEKGYYLTTVEHKMTEVDSLNRCGITFTIDEGTKTKIKTFEIEGNRALTDVQIKKRLNNKEKRWYRTGNFKEEKFSEDLDRITELYYRRGYLDFKIVDKELNQDGRWLNIIITVDEGKQYYAGNVKFDGNQNIDTEAMKRVLKLKRGEPFNLDKSKETLQELYSLYAEDGYIYAQIAPEEEISGDTLNITYRIVEGDPARINMVIIKGNERTNEKVIRRVVVSVPGMIFRRSEVIRSQRDIFNLGFFEDIKIDSRRANDEGDIDLIYDVKEKTVGTLGAGVSYSAQDKLTGYVELTQPNLFGRAHSIHTKFEKGGRLTNIEAGYNVPWLFDTRASGGADIYYTTRFWDYYYKQDRGGIINVSNPLLLDYTRGYYSLRIERTRITDIDPYYRPETGGYDIRNDTIPRTLLVPGLTFARDSRDYIFNPSLGTYLSYSINHGFVFGDTAYKNYTKQIVEARVYLPVYWKFVLMAKGRFGLVESAKRVPVYERFYAGGVGPDGVRGYPDRSLGPREAGFRIGGKAIFINILELKLRLTQGFGILAFFDMGEAFPSIKDVNFFNLKRGAGLGVRLEVPMMGIIGFDFAYGFDKDRPGFEPHFQIGRSF